jgi:flagellar motor switch protein FliN
MADEKENPSDSEQPDAAPSPPVDETEERSEEEISAENIIGSADDDDIEAQMAAVIAMEDKDLDDDDLEKQMAEAMNSEADSKINDSILEALSDDEPVVSVQPLRFQQLKPSDEHIPKDNIDRLLDVSLNVSVELGRKQMQIKEILELGPGKIIELEKLAGEPVDLLVNGKLLARGEVVVVDENFGVRITDLIDLKDRIKML